jgi:hypothetical protein
VAHDADEAAEFVLSLVHKLGNSQAVERARDMAETAKQRCFHESAECAFEIAEKAFPIPKEESRALLESAGSLLELCRMASASEIARRSPLSDKDARAVAEVLFGETQDVVAGAGTEVDNVRKFF